MRITGIAGLALLLLGGLQAAAAQSVYRDELGELLIPCLRANTGPHAAYYEALFLYRNQQLYQFLKRRIEPASPCSGRYDPVTGVYSDVVRYGDDFYDLRMHKGSGTSFRLGAFRYRARGTSTLWKVSDGLNEFYLGGSIHVLKQSDYPLHSAFYEAYAQAEVLVTEVEIDALDNVDPEDHGIRLLPEGRTIADEISPRAYRILGNYMDSLDYDLAAYERYRAVWLDSVLYTGRLRQLGYRQVPGVDRYFAGLAADDGKPNLGLESVREQFETINATKRDRSAEEVIMDRIYSLLFTFSKEPLDNNVQAWRRGDSYYYEQGVIAGMKAQSREDYETLIVERNLAWLPALEALLLTPEVELVIVGAAHLYGEDSLIRLLEDAGYSVELF